jgi:hypothetical protein
MSFSCTASNMQVEHRHPFAVILPVVTPSGFVGECKLRAPYFRNALVGGQKRGRFCLTPFRACLPGYSFQGLSPIRLDSVGRYAGRGPLFNGRHPPRRAPALRVGYLPWVPPVGTSRGYLPGQGLSPYIFLPRRCFQL